MINSKFKFTKTKWIWAGRGQGSGGDQVRGQDKQLANIVFSSGASQFTFVEGQRNRRSTGEVVGLPSDEYRAKADHPASFRLWMKERIVKQLT